MLGTHPGHGGALVTETAPRPKKKEQVNDLRGRAPASNHPRRLLRVSPGPNQHKESTSTRRRLAIRARPLQTRKEGKTKAARLLSHRADLTGPGTRLGTRLSRNDSVTETPSMTAHGTCTGKGLHTEPLA
ncbi:hypothetical protein GCM10017687_35060 [Streptomyces echinatus]